MLAGGSLGLDRQLRPGFLRHGARCCPPQWALRSEGCCTSYHEGRGKEKRGTAKRSLFLATGPTECSWKPSNLSELVELVNSVTEKHYGKYNKADHEKSRITSNRRSFLVCRRAVVVTNAVADAPGISQAETSHALLATRAHTPT
jgi:hypothetical protein